MKDRKRQTDVQIQKGRQKNGRKDKLTRRQKQKSYRVHWRIV